MFLCGGLLGFLAVLFACRFQKRTFCWLDLVVALLLMMPLLSFAVREKNHECYPDILVSRTSGLLALGNGWLEYHKTIEKDQMIVDHPVFPKGLQRSPKSDDLLGVILIGESATRGRFSLYGCSRETCPKMKRNMDQMILFSSAVSQFAHTNMAFKSIFAVSAQPDMPPEACFDAVLNQAGYQTEYLSSVWERAKGWNAWSYATRQLFSSTKMTSVADTHEIPFYDEELLPFLKDMIDRSASAPKIIFVNWSGSHFPPEHHVPESRRVFSKGLQADFDRDDYQQTILAYYDDSILYDDDLLFRITEMLNASARPAFLLYFSDHGQNFTDDQHGKWVPRDRTVAQCYEIPLFLWFNRKYAERFPAL